MPALRRRLPACVSSVPAQDARGAWSWHGDQRIRQQALSVSIQHGGTRTRSAVLLVHVWALDAQQLGGEAEGRTEQWLTDNRKESSRMRTHKPTRW